MCQLNWLMAVWTRITSGCCEADRRMPDRAAGHSGFEFHNPELEVGLIVVSAVVTITITIAVVAHVVHGAAVAFLEACPEVALFFVAADRRMLVHLVIIGVSVTAVLVVMASCFHAFVEPLTLGIAVVIGIALPVATILILILR